MNSRKEREANNLSLPTLAYGEILFPAFADVLRGLGRAGLEIEKRHHKFVDIGSGSGKPVFSAGLILQFDNCVGIEILEGLSGIANSALANWDENVKATAPEHSQTTMFEFIHGDALVIDWHDADVVFINSTCFSDELLGELSVLCEGLHEGAVVITATKKLPSQKFQLCYKDTMEEAWGAATVFIHRRQPDA